MKIDFTKDSIMHINGVQIVIASASNPDPTEMMVSLANVEATGGFGASVITAKGMQALRDYCKQHQLTGSANFVENLQLGPMISIEGFTAERMTEEEIRAAMAHELFHIRKGKVLPSIIDNTPEAVFDLEEEMEADRYGALASSKEAMASVIKKCIRSSIEAHHLLRMGGVVHPELADTMFSLQMTSSHVQSRLQALGAH